MENDALLRSSLIEEASADANLQEAKNELHSDERLIEIINPDKNIEIPED